MTSPAKLLVQSQQENFRKRCLICLKLTIKTPERRQCGRSGVFIVNFEHIQGVLQNLFLGGCSAKKCDHDCTSAHEKQKGICIVYIH